MSKNLNKVMLTGNLGKDPETNYVPSGSAVTKFSVASTRKYRTAEGEDREDTEWFNIVAWGKLAEICAQYLHKGSRVYIEGRLQTRSWEDQATGQKRYMTEVVASDMIMLDARGATQGDDESEPVVQPERETRASSGPPSRPAPAQRRPAAPPPTDEDDLPF